MSQSAFENLNLHKSWHDSAWLPILNSGNVLEYFSDRSNPFYDRQCNNEIIKMQRLNPDQLMNMQGTEYILLHFQDPIMYVVRQQHRYSPTQVTVIADYYIIAGVIYQAPDLNSVISSRLLNTVHNLGSAFEEAHSFSRYHPSKGYWWEFKDSAKQEKQLGKEKKKKRDYSGSTFQRNRVDALLKDFEMKFAVKRPPVFIPEKTDETVKIEPKIEIKTEKPSDRAAANSQPNVKPPPEKRPKMIR